VSTRSTSSMGNRMLIRNTRAPRCAGFISSPASNRCTP
jgi:hypothetical protein